MVSIPITVFRRPVVIAGLVVVAAAGMFAALLTHQSTHAAEPPPHLGTYQVVPPALFEGARLAAATAARSAVWSDGITRFPGATPISTVYDKGGKPWLYVWGAEGKLDDPAGELNDFWQASDPLAAPMGVPVEEGDPEPTGPLGGFLQCQTVFQVCAWADGSGVFVVSPQPFGQTDLIVIGPATAVTINEQQMAAMTLSFRGVAEHLKREA